MKRHLLLATLLGIGLLAIGQDAPTPFYRQYATQQYMKQLMGNHPEMIEARSAIERLTSAFELDGNIDSVILPIVFHQIGATLVLTNEDILSQIDALNRDFNNPRYVEDENTPQAWEAEQFKEAAAYPKIRFCLAKSTPSGEPTTGILYVPSATTEFPIGNTIAQAETGSLPWDTKRYINIWVAPLAEGTAGFAQMPGGPASSDGIVINTVYFKRANTFDFEASNPLYAKYSLGRTLSHLMATYLNVYELWDENNPCGDDMVDDTPIHNAPNMGQPLYRHVSTCGSYPVEMTMNIMDGTDDVGQFMFTRGQMKRMYATISQLAGPRSKLRNTETQCSLGGLIGGDEYLDERNTSMPDATEAGLGLKIFPNPAQDAFTVIVPSACHADLSISVINEFGVVIYERHYGNTVIDSENKFDIKTPNWPSGIYAVKVTCGDKRQSSRLLLQR